MDVLGLLINCTKFIAKQQHPAMLELIASGRDEKEPPYSYNAENRDAVPTRHVLIARGICFTSTSTASSERHCASRHFHAGISTAMLP
ncbi:hypothetical protein M0804_001072 [Polistes exclamans]|nr:hypothetical protein M0804_001072 [Polistes exclamans]